MKRIIFILPAFFFLNASGQSPRLHYNTPEGSISIPLKKGLTVDSTSKIKEMIQQLQKDRTLGKLIFTQPNGVKVYALPKDGMPCLVPDLSKTNYTMPNAGKGIKITGMPPRSAPPNQLIPNDR